MQQTLLENLQSNHHEPILCWPILNLVLNLPPFFLNKTGYFSPSPESNVSMPSDIIPRPIFLGLQWPTHTRKEISLHPLFFSHIINHCCQQRPWNVMSWKFWDFLKVLDFSTFCWFATSGFLFIKSIRAPRSTFSVSSHFITLTYSTSYTTNHGRFVYVTNLLFLYTN